MTRPSSVTSRPASKQRRPSSARMVFKGVLFDVWQWKQALFNGTTAVFETLHRPDTVLILPVLHGGQVIFAEETQPGMPTMFRALGGRVMTGELPEEAARRELLEESGYKVEELRLWDAWQPVNKIDWAVYLYVAHGLSDPSGVALDAGEQIALRTLSVTTLLDPNSDLTIDDYELLHKLYFARSDARERERVARLFDPHAR